MALDPNFAQILALFMESAGWGVHFVLYIWAIYTLVDARKLSGLVPFWSVTVLATLLLSIGTLDLGLQVYISYMEVVIRGNNRHNPVPASIQLLQVRFS